MEYTVRLARQEDFDVIDRITYQGYVQALKEMSDARALNRASSYLCTIKGSAVMRSADAMTFVCVEKIDKPGFLKTLFQRTGSPGTRRRARRSSDMSPNNEEVRQGIQTLLNKHRASDASLHKYFNERSPSEDDSTATGSSSAGSAPGLINKRRHRDYLPPTDDIHHMGENAIPLIAADVSPEEYKEYANLKTLRDESGFHVIKAGVRTRLMRQEGPAEKLWDLNSSEQSHVLDSFDPSRGISVYKKPSPEVVESISRPSPVLALDFQDDVTEDTASSSKVSASSPKDSAAERVIGCVTYAPFESGWTIVSDINEVEIRMLCVPAIRGVAGILIDHCIKVADDEKRTAIHVLVASTNKAAHILYVRHGFHRNAPLDKVDQKTGQALKCFTIGLGHPKPVLQQRTPEPEQVVYKEVVVEKIVEKVIEVEKPLPAKKVVAGKRVPIIQQVDEKSEFATRKEGGLVKHQ